MLGRLERQVDPDGTLPPEERGRLVKAAARELSARLNAAKARKRAGVQADVNTPAVRDQDLRFGTGVAVWS